MLQQNAILILLLAKLPAVFAFTPQFSVLLGEAPNIAAMPIASGVATAGTDLGTVSKSALSGANFMLLSVAQESEIVTQQGTINWENPAQAIIGTVFLLYVAFSILAGILACNNDL